MATVNGTSGKDFIHVSGDGLVAPAGYTDNASATTGDDTIFSGGGGDDIIHAGDGNDTISFNDDLDGNDQIDGGVGANDVLLIHEPVSVTFGLNSLTGIEVIRIPHIVLPPNTGGNVDLVMNDGNVAAGDSMTIDASAAGAAINFSVNYATESDANQITVYGGAGSDVIRGRAHENDQIHVETGGSDHITAGGQLYFGASLDATDRINQFYDGGMYVDGDYSAGLTLTGTMITQSHFLTIGPTAPGAVSDYSYNFTTTDDLIPATNFFTVMAYYTVAGTSVHFNASAETDGNFYYYGGPADDTVTGGAKNDSIDIRFGGTDTANGGGGDDAISTDQSFDSADRIDGGPGYDTLTMGGDSHVIPIDGTTVANIEKIALAQSSLYQFTETDAGVAAGQTLTVDGSLLTSVFGQLSFDGSAELDGQFVLIAGVGTATLSGGAGADRFDLTATANGATVAGGGGADTFLFTAANLGATDTVYGDTQTDNDAALDTLQFTTAGTVAASAFDNVSHIEQIVLANGANNVSLTDALVGSADDGHVLAVVGGPGNDTINATGVTTTANRVFFTAGTGNDILAGGFGADTFYFATAALTSGDTVNGNSGAAIDRIVFTTAGTVAAAALQNVSHVEQLVLANGTNNVTLSNAVVAAADSHILFVLGGTGNDTVNANAVTTAANRVYITAGAGSDTLTGGAGLDIFYFAAADLTSSDSVNGGTGASSDAIDFTSAGIIGASAFQNVTHIEQVILANGANNLTLTSALVGSSDAGHVLTVNGGTADDVIDAGSVSSAADRVYFIPASGADTLTGGAGADDFFFTVADLTTADTVSGGTGTAIDSIVFITAGAIATSAFHNVSHMEQIVLAPTGTNNLTLTDALVSGADDSHVFYVGGAGTANDTISAAAVTTATNRVFITAGSGIDVVTGGAGADTFYFTAANLTSADTVNGGTGASVDRIVFTTAGTIDASAFQNVTHVEQLILANGTNSVTLSNAMVDSADDNQTLYVVGGTGNDTIDASAVIFADRGTGIGPSSGIVTSTDSIPKHLVFTGGGGADVITAGVTVNTFVYAAASDSTGTGYDTINSFTYSEDSFDIPGGPGTITSVEAARSGALDSGANFDTELAARFSTLAAHHAGLLTASSGTLSGQTFLVVDLNGTAGYQAGSDLVLHLVSPTGTLVAADFV